MNKRTEIDAYVGSRIFQSRRQAKVTRLALAKFLGISHQQLAKYETGRDRISAGKIPLVAKKLKKDINFFFDGWEEIKTLS